MIITSLTMVLDKYFCPILCWEGWLFGGEKYGLSLYQWLSAAVEPFTLIGKTFLRHYKNHCALFCNGRMFVSILIFGVVLFSWVAL